MESSSVRNEVERRFARLEGGASRHVFARLYPEAARAAADAADARRALGISLGPLDGTVVSIKDLFDVAGEPTGAGSAILGAAPPAAADAPVVRRLRRARAVILGKTNMSEFGFTGLGLNPHLGTPGNAADPRLVPGGSVRIPAALDGVVGFKPTVGSVPTEDAFPLAYTLDSVGPSRPARRRPPSSRISIPCRSGRFRFRSPASRFRAAAS